MLPQTPTQGARFGRFVVLSRLGIGGMGEVFRARPSDGGAEVALKLMRPDLASDPRFKRMFAAEAQIAARLDHPRIVRLVDFGEVGEQPFLALELIDGAALDRILSDGPLEVDLAVHVTQAVLEALDHAHELADADGPLGLVHRDVSTSNVLVSREGAVKLTDFGVVKVEGLSLTLTDEVKGKRGYMAPEQQRPGAAIDRRVDVFAAGVLLQELIMGSRPRDPAEAARVTIDGPLGEIIRRALATNPADRFPSAAAFRDALAESSDPCPDAAARLKERISRARAREAPLAALDRLIIGQLGPEAPVVTATRTPSTPSRPDARARQRIAAITAVTVLAALIAAATWAWSRSTAPSGPLTNEPGATPRPPAELVVPGLPAPELVVRAADPPPAPHLEPPAPRPTVRKDAAKPGKLTLDTEPWGIAYLGERKLGPTPFAGLPLPSGTHTLRIDVEGRGHFRPVKVKVAPGEETRMAVKLR